MIPENATCEHIDALNAEAYAIRSTHSARAFELAQQALQLSEEVDYPFGAGCAHRTLAGSLTLVSLADTFSHALSAIDILSSHGHMFEAVTAYPALFIYYVHTEQWEMARTTIDDCISIAKEVGNTSALALGYYNRGYLHMRFERNEDADRDFADAYGLLQLPRDQKLNSLILCERATIASRVQGSTFDLRDLDSAIETASGLELLDLLRGRCMYLLTSSDYRAAKSAYRHARKRCEAQHATHALIRLLNGYAIALHNIGRTNHARKVQLGALKLTEKGGFEVVRHLQLRRLAEYEFECRMYEQSARHYQEYLPLKESLFCSSKEVKLSDFQILKKVDRLHQETLSLQARESELSQINHQLHTALERQTTLQKELMRLATTDELTGALNRRQVLNDGILEMERYIHMAAPFTVSILDIDHFKTINDTFGHATGDEVLRRLAKACQAILRKFDVFGRLGGEEFCIIHHDSNMSGAIKAVERLQKAVSQLFVADILGDRTLTVSIGIAEVRREDATFFDVLHQADMALYEAKRGGRNTFRTAQTRFLEAA